MRTEQTAPGPSGATSGQKWAVVGLLLLFLTPAGVILEEDLRAQAEEAYRYDRYPEAIELYQRILENAPEDTAILKRLALILSWENRLEESITYYEKAMGLEPGDEEARRELAKIYSWDGELSKSETLYRELVKDHPEDDELKLKLAEILSWQGRFQEARSMYQWLLDRKQQAIPAAVGMGNVAAWDGDLDLAAQWYRKVLKADPDNEAARLGLARVHNWNGLKAAAIREVDEALRRSPDSREAQKLHHELHFAMRPNLQPSYDRTLDTDGNDLQTSRVGLNLHTDPQTTVDLVYEHHDAEFRCEVAAQCEGVDISNGSERTKTEADSLAGRYQTRISDIFFFNGKFGAERLRSFDGKGRTGLVGGGSVDIYPTKEMGFGFGYHHESITDTARLIHNNLRYDSIDGRFHFEFAERWKLRVGAERGWLSDDNTRFQAYGTLELRLRIPRVRSSLIYSSRYLSYEENPNDPTDPGSPLSGYFAPQRFWSNVLTARVGGEAVNRRLYYAAEVSGGIQRFRQRPTTFATGDNDTVFGWNLLSGFNLSERLAFEASYGRTDYAQQIASGYESRHYNFFLKVIF